MWIPACRRPTYSPDLAPSNYYLFPIIIKDLGGHHFARVDDVMNAVDNFLSDQNGAFDTEAICLLYDRWTRCVNEGRDYVEK